MFEFNTSLIQHHFQVLPFRQTQQSALRDDNLSVLPKTKPLPSHAQSSNTCHSPSLAPTYASSTIPYPQHPLHEVARKENVVRGYCYFIG